MRICEIIRRGGGSEQPLVLPGVPKLLHLGHARPHPNPLPEGDGTGPCGQFAIESGIGRGIRKLPSDMNTPSKERLLAELRSSGISDERVLAAVAEVPRDEFVPGQLRPRAYENVALPIEEDQTISQPMVVAHMVQVVHPSQNDHVLEIGTGSGYGAAVLSRLAHDVITVEIRPGLAEHASRRLHDLGYTNVRVVVSDGSLGWQELAPYDAIVVTAAAPSLPPDLLRQLSSRGGRIVAPVGSLREQQLVFAERRGGRIKSQRIGGVRFVPLQGSAGFAILDSDRRN